MTKIFFFLLGLAAVFGQEKKINVAVLDLDGESLTAEERTALTNKLILELSKTEQYNIIERGRIKDILKEQGFQQAVCSDQSCLVEMGQLLGVEQLITGSIVKFGNLYSLYVKILNVTTGEIIKNVNLELTVSMEEVLTQGIKQAVNQLTKSKEESKKTEAVSIQQTQAKLKTSNLILYSAAGAVAAAGGAWIYFLSKASGSYDDYQSAENSFDSKYALYESYQKKSLGTGLTAALFLPAPIYFWLRSDKLKKQIESAR